MLARSPVRVRGHGCQGNPYERSRGRRDGWVESMLLGLWADCMIGIGCALVCTNVSGGWYNLTVRHGELDRVGGVGWDWFVRNSG